jgi:hypothetical protein
MSDDLLTWVASSQKSRPEAEQVRYGRESLKQMGQLIPACAQCRTETRRNHQETIWERSRVVQEVEKSWFYQMSQYTYQSFKKREAFASYLGEIPRDTQEMHFSLSSASLARSRPLPFPGKGQEAMIRAQHKC